MPVSRAGVLSSRGMALPECLCQGEPTCVYAVHARALVRMFLKENPGDTVPYEMTWFLWTRVRRHRRAAVFSWLPLVVLTSKCSWLSAGSG